MITKHLHEDGGSIRWWDNDVAIVVVLQKRGAKEVHSGEA